MPAATTVEHPLRVLYVHHVGTRGGSSNSLRFLLQSFPTGAVEPLVLSPPGSAADAFRAAGILVKEIPSVVRLSSSAGTPLRGRRLLVLAREVAALRSGRIIRGAISDFRPDIVHLNERSLLHAAWIAKQAAVPVILHARNVADRDTPWIHKLTVRLIRRYVDLMIAIDGSVRHSLREIDRCRIVYNPLPIEPDSSPGCHRTGERGVHRPLRVTFLSTLIPCKGVWDLLEAAKLLRHRKDIIIQIAGGNSRPRAFYDSLVGKLCDRAGIISDVESQMREMVRCETIGNVVMLGHVAQVTALLEDTDILVFPSHLNGPPRSVFEAGVRGIPAIVSMRDRIEDVVRGGVTGFVVPERDPHAVATAIERLADDRGLRRRLGGNARRIYSDQFDPERSARETLACYHSLLTNVPAAGDSHGVASPVHRVDPA